MDRSINYVKMDLTDSGIYRDVITAMQGDNKSRYLYVTIENDGEPFSLENMYPVFRGTKPDGTTIFNPCEIEEGIIIVELTAQILAVEGMGMFEIAIYEQTPSSGDITDYSNAKCIASFPFNINVVKSSFDATNMESTDEFQVLERVIANLPLLAHLDDVIDAEAKLNEIKAQIGNNTLGTSVPSDAVFTDTTYEVSIDPNNEDTIVLTDSSGVAQSVTIKVNQVNGHTVESNVPANAKFTDENTTYRLGLDSQTNELTLTDSDNVQQRVTIPVAGDAQTVNGHTVNSDVPAGAVFTDTTYSPATSQVDGLMTSTEHVKLDGIESGAEVNQNAFSHVKVGLNTIHASHKMDTVELIAGNNISLTPNTTNKSVTISSTSGATDLVHRDTTANWNAQRDLIGALGHIYIYTDHDNVAGVDIPGLKVGDGLGYLIDAPFIDGNASSLVNHINNTDIHVTLQEKAFWNDKVTCFLSQANNENIVFTKE